MPAKRLAKRYETFNPGYSIVIWRPGTHRRYFWELITHMRSFCVQQLIDGIVSRFRDYNYKWILDVLFETSNDERFMLLFHLVMEYTMKIVFDEGI